METTYSKAPFPYFGGKSLITEKVWQLFGNDCVNYLEPFAGSLAVLLARPTPFTGCETINDKDCFLINAWRAMTRDPEDLAVLCVDVVSEVNTEATHHDLVKNGEGLRECLGDPHFYDLERAAWWIKGMNEWIGSGFCSGNGSWQWSADNGWAKRDAGTGVNRQLPHLGDAGTGVDRQLPHLGDAGKGVNRQLPHLGNAGKGVNRQLPHLGNAGKGYYQQRVEWLTEWFCALRDRLCAVRISCGDWQRVVSSYSTTTRHGLTAVFLDPPYESTEYVYAESESISKQVREWCSANGDNHKLRIVLCGRGEGHDALIAKGWNKHHWKTRKGYGMQSANSEALWISPHCCNHITQESLF